MIVGVPLCKELVNTMADEWIRIAAPATTSNIGAGFDVFGLALKEPYDIIEGRKIESGIVISEVSGPGSEGIPTDPDQNSVSIAAKEVLRRCEAEFGIEIRIKKGIRPCSGIGSSGASAAGGAFLAHILCGEKLSLTEVVLCAAQPTTSRPACSGDSRSSAPTSPSRSCRSSPRRILASSWPCPT